MANQIIQGDHMTTDKKATLYHFDTEFIEDGTTIDLISLGIVCEDGRELYLLNWDCDHSKANDWVKENVLKTLPERHRGNLVASAGGVFGRYVSHCRIAMEVKKFCNPETHGNPEFWAYYADYDWVVFCQLFGTMMDLPDGFPMYCRDIKQLCDSLGNPALPKQGDGEHNALEDARWNKQAYEYLMSLRGGRE